MRLKASIKKAQILLLDVAPLHPHAALTPPQSPAPSPRIGAAGGWIVGDYDTPQCGQVAAGTAATPTLHVGTYRRALLAVIIGQPLFTDAEQVLANHNAHECQDAAQLAKWTRNLLAERTRRQAAADAQVLADMAAGIEKFQDVVAEQAGADAPAASQPDAPAEPWATPAQCDEVFALACRLSQREKADALRRLPQLTEREAAAFIRGLKLRQGPRYWVEATVVGRPALLTVAARHHEAAKVDYVRDEATGRVLPRLQTTYGGPLVRRVWAN